jgi:hypothetical protein
MILVQVCEQIEWPYIAHSWMLPGPWSLALFRGGRTQKREPSWVWPGIEPGTSSRLTEALRRNHTTRPPDLGRRLKWLDYDLIFSQPILGTQVMPFTACALDPFPSCLECPHMAHELFRQRLQPAVAHHSSPVFPSADVATAAAVNASRRLSIAPSLPSVRQPRRNVKIYKPVVSGTKEHAHLSKLLNSGLYLPLYPTYPPS